QGKCQHPKLPFPCEDIEMSLKCVDGRLTVKRLFARSETTQIAMSGNAILPSVSENFVGTVELNDLPICRQLCARLPESVQQLYTTFHPNGPVNVKLEVERSAGRWLKKRCLLQPDKMDASFV